MDTHYYTPPQIFEALAVRFDLDVCAPPGIALVGHAKSAWHPELWAKADAVAMPFAYFDFVGGSVFMPVWFAAFGEECAEALHRVGVVRVRSEVA
jgi:hypothetical protein